MKKGFILLYSITCCNIIYCQNVGIGTTTPKVKLHVLKGVQTVAPNIGSTMAVQSDGETFLQILSNDIADQNGITFGHTTQPISAGITFNFSGNRELAFFTNASAPSLVLNNQGKVGIGVISPLARLHVADSNVIFTGPGTLPGSTIYNPPVQGAGTRMMWYPQKAAFRVGGINGTQWDKNNIGNYSFASGYNSIASGDYSTALGNQDTASAIGSTAMGSGTKASASYAFSIGYNTKATGSFSTAMGGGSVASGLTSIALGTVATASGANSLAVGQFATASQDFAIAIGRYATATNYSSVSIGEKNTASGAFSVSMGIGTNAVGESSVSFGNNTVAKARGGFTTGLYNDNMDFPDNNVSDANDRIFQIGNGMDGARSNAITVLRDANTGVGTLTPVARLHVADSNVVFTGPAIVPAGTNYNPPIQGAGTRMMWYPQKAAFRVGNVNGTQWDKNNIGSYSLASGYNTTASGGYSTSMGGGTTASGFASTALGGSTVASGLGSTALGQGTIASGDQSTSIGIFTQASGFASTVMGFSANALGDISTAIGLSTTAKSYLETAIGAYNTDYQPVSGTSWNSADRLFIIGNGRENANSDAMVVLKNGNVGIGASNPQAYGHGGNNKIVEIFNSNTVDNAQSQLILSSNGTAGSLGGITWAAPTVQGSEKRTGFIGNIFQTVNQTKLAFFTRNESGELAERFNLQGDGNAWMQGSLSQNSDLRLKKNVRPIDNALYSLQQLNGYTYTWRDINLDNHLQSGVIAQEVQKIFPHLVTNTAEGSLSVNYIGLIPVLIESIKEQQKQIEELRQLIKNLINK